MTPEELADIEQRAALYVTMGEPVGATLVALIAEARRANEFIGRVEELESTAEVYRDLRAAVEALAEHAEAKAPSAMRSGGVAIVTTAELRALLAPAPAPEVERCPECRHVPHDRIGFCPNMASDNDCSCTYSAPTPPTTVQADPWNCPATGPHAPHPWRVTPEVSQNCGGVPTSPDETATVQADRDAGQALARLVDQAINTAGDEAGIERAQADGAMVRSALAARRSDPEPEVWMASGPGRPPSYHWTEADAKASFSHPGVGGWHRYHEGHSSSGDGYFKVTRLTVQPTNDKEE